MATSRTDQFEVVFDDGWRAERMPIGIAAGHLWVTFVFTRESLPAIADDSGWDLFEDLESRLRVKGVDGTLGHGRQGGGGNARRYSMNFSPELNGTTDIEVTYVKGRKTVAKETISLGLESVAPAVQEISEPPQVPVVLYDDLMPVHYGYIYLSAGSEPSDDLNGTRAGQRNGLLGAQAPNQVSMVTGLHTGEVPLKIEWHPNEPAIDGSWEDVVEASVEFGESDALLSSFDEFIGIELPATGWHRVRYCANRMDEGRALDTPDDDETAPDQYLLQMWPAPPGADEVKVLGSSNAEYWHGVATGKNR
jgi:hypothetical protein